LLKKFVIEIYNIGEIGNHFLGKIYIHLLSLITVLAVYIEAVHNCHCAASSHYSAAACLCSVC